MRMYHYAWFDYALFNYAYNLYAIDGLCSKKVVMQSNIMRKYIIDRSSR